MSYGMIGLRAVLICVLGVATIIPAADIYGDLLVEQRTAQITVELRRKADALSARANEINAQTRQMLCDKLLRANRAADLPLYFSGLNLYEHVSTDDIPRPWRWDEHMDSLLCIGLLLLVFFAGILIIVYPWEYSDHRDSVPPDNAPD